MLLYVYLVFILIVTKIKLSEGISCFFFKVAMLWSDEYDIADMKKSKGRQEKRTLSTQSLKYKCTKQSTVAKLNDSLMALELPWL